MEAYRHQVGGHSRLMKPQDSSKVYKPFSESEFRFYEKLARLGSTATDSGPLHVLKQFVPKYFGVTEVQVQTTCLPPIHFPPGAHRHSTSHPATTGINPIASQSAVTDPSVSCQPSDGMPTSSATTTTAVEEDQNNEHSSDSKAVDTERRTDTGDDGDGNLKNGNPPLSSSSKHVDVDASDKSPVIDTGQQSQSSQQVLTTPTSSSRSSVLKYMVLEDLVYQYKKPCVLDVKMGKRQRKIGASPEKEQRQLEKSLKTTSHAVGFRLCGMQFYDKKNDVLCYRDKYWGRKLTKDKLRQAIGQWFWNGYIVYHELLLPLISSLKILYSCISELRHYRFWSSSLLWVFDGGLTDANARLRSLDVRMIDFANTIVLKDNPSPDDEYLFGLGNLISILESLIFSPTVSPLSQPPSARERRLSISPSRQGVFSRPSCATLALDKAGSSESQPTEEEERADAHHNEYLGESTEYNDSCNNSSSGVEKSHLSLDRQLVHHTLALTQRPDLSSLRFNGRPVQSGHRHQLSTVTRNSFDVVDDPLQGTSTPRHVPFTRPTSVTETPLTSTQSMAGDSEFDINNRPKHNGPTTRRIQSNHRPSIDQKPHPESPSQRHHSPRHIFSPSSAPLSSNLCSSSTHQIPQFSDLLFSHPPHENIIVLNSPKSLKSTTEQNTAVSSFIQPSKSSTRHSPRSLHYHHHMPEQKHSQRSSTSPQQPHDRSTSRLRHYHLMKWQEPQQLPHSDSIQDSVVPNADIGQTSGVTGTSLKPRSHSISHHFDVTPSCPSMKTQRSVHDGHPRRRKSLVKVPGHDPRVLVDSNNDKSDAVLPQPSGLYHQTDASSKRRSKQHHHGQKTKHRSLLKSELETTTNLEREMLNMVEEYDAGCRADIEDGSDEGSLVDHSIEGSSGGDHRRIDGTNKKKLSTAGQRGQSSRTEQAVSDIDRPASQAPAQNRASATTDLTLSSSCCKSASMHDQHVHQLPSQQSKGTRHLQLHHRQGGARTGAHSTSTRRRTVLHEEEQGIDEHRDSLTSSSFHRNCVSAPSLLHLIDSCMSPKERGVNPEVTTYSRCPNHRAPPLQPRRAAGASPATAQEATFNGEHFKSNQKNVSMMTSNNVDPVTSTAAQQAQKPKKTNARHGSTALGAFTLPASVASLQLGRSDGSESYSTSSEDLVNQGDIDESDHNIEGSDTDRHQWGRRFSRMSS